MLSYLPVVVGVVFVAWAFHRWRRSHALQPKGEHYVMFWDGTTLVAYPCKVTDVGIETADGTAWPRGMYQVREVDQVWLYLVAAQPVPLADHRALEQARRTIALKALFTGGGELLRYLQIGALVIPIIVYLLLLSSFSAVQAQLNTVSANVQIVKTWTEKPLVVQPGQQDKGDKK